jgi:hypothetical protein
MTDHIAHLIAYPGGAATKAAILAQIRAHRLADQIVKGEYWEDGKGCAVGCTIHSSDHAEYETRFGIPQTLAWLEDRIFEGLPNAEAMLWPERFMDAINVGADLSRVGWEFLHWVLTDSTINPEINHPLVRDVVKQCADVLVPLTKGQPIDEIAAADAWDASRAASMAASISSRAVQKVMSETMLNEEWIELRATTQSAWIAANVVRDASHVVRDASHVVRDASAVIWSAPDVAVNAAKACADVAEIEEMQTKARLAVEWISIKAVREVARSEAFTRMAEKLIELLSATSSLLEQIDDLSDAINKHREGIERLREFLQEDRCPVGLVCLEIEEHEIAIAVLEEKREGLKRLTASQDEVVLGLSERLDKQK